jgi:hypothetical protein
MGFSNLFFNLSHLYNENIFAEYIFSVIFCPRTPYIFDCVGYAKDFLESDLMLTEPTAVFASEYLIEEKLNFLVKQAKKPIFMFDLSDFTSPIYGRIIDRPILQRLTSNFGRIHV